MKLSLKHRLSLRAQRYWGFINFIWFGPLFAFLLRYLGAYRSPEREKVRKQLRVILSENPGRPVLICANHLTMIDSMLITWLLFDLRTLFFHFERFPWNVPELTNFGKNIFLRAMCYLGKCVYVERKGSLESRRLSWAKVRHLHSNGDFVCIFPEGGRSKTGRIEHESAVYGVGQLVQDNDNTLVIAVYLRGRNQEVASFFPKRGERFFIDISLCACPQSSGRRGQKEITLAILDQLARLEEKYYAYWQ